MKKLYLVTVGAGPGWVDGVKRAEQPEWTLHADFMNQLVDQGVIVIGGPINETEAVLAMDAKSENEIRQVYSCDPWMKSGVLQIKEIREWTILLEQGVEHKV